MSQLAELVKRRDEIIEDISKIQSMRKGTLNATYTKVTHKDGALAVRGPYYKLSRKGKNNKTQSWSVLAKDAELVQEEVDNYRRFRKLADEFVEVCEEISLLSQPQDDVKKN
jgi:hypothetical protein